MNNANLIGILGGTFDPIQNGHLHLAQSALQHCQLTQVRLLPAKNPVHRDPTVADEQARLAMLQLAVDGDDRIVIDHTELDRDGPSYMVDTLDILKRDSDKNNTLCLIMGLDAFLHFDSWKEWERIFELAHLIVARRPFTPPNISNTLEKALEQRKADSPNDLHESTAGLIYFLQDPMLDISATNVREKVRSGESLTADCPTAVAKYIEESGLYLDNTQSN